MSEATAAYGSLSEATTDFGFWPNAVVEAAAAASISISISIEDCCDASCSCVDLYQCQKRPTTASKETYYSVKRDLVYRQKRPSI